MAKQPNGRQGENVLKQTHKLGIAVITIQIKRTGRIPTEISDETIPACVELIQQALAEADERARPDVSNHWGGRDLASAVADEAARRVDAAAERIARNGGRLSVRDGAEV